jgi:TP901 family phage tail tape measure protein
MAHVIDAIITLRDQLSGTLKNVNANLSQFQRQATFAGKNMISVGKDLEKVGGNLTKTITLPIVGLGVAAVAAAATFTHQMADIRKEVVATAGSASKANSIMSQMSKSSLQWSEDFGQSTDSINAGLLTLVKDGYSGSVAMSVMQTALNTARGSNEDLTTAVNTLGTSLEAYGLKTNNAAKTTQNMTHMADTFAYIANHTKASISSLGEAFSIVGPTASALKQPMEQTAAAIGILQSNGIDASTAATSLKSGLVNLTKPTKKMSAAMKEMGLNAFDSKGSMKDLPTLLNNIEKGTTGWTNQQKEAAVATIFGKESLASWNVLLAKGGGNLSALSKSAKGATGETQKLSDSMKNTSVNQFSKLKESIHALGVVFGEDILPLLTPIVNKLTDMAKSFSNLDDNTKKSIIKFALIAAAVGPPILIIGKLTHGIGQTIDGFTRLSKSISNAGGILKYLATPGGIVIVVIMAIAVAAFLLIKYWGPISTFFKKVWNEILAVTQKVWAAIGPTIMGAVNKIVAFWNAIWPELKTVFEFVFKVLAVIVGPYITGIYVIIKAVLGFIMGCWKDAWNVIKDYIKLVWDVISGVIKYYWDLISGLIQIGLDILTGHWGAAWTHIKELVVTLWHDIGSLFGNIATDALKWGSDFVKGLIDGIKGAIGGVIDAVKGIGSTIKSYLHFSVPDVGPLTDYMSWMPDMLKGMSQGIKVNTHLVTDKVKDIAVGIKANVQQGTTGAKGSTGSTGSGGASKGGFNLTVNMYGNVSSDSDIDRFANALVLKLNTTAANMA